MCRDAAMHFRDNTPLNTAHEATYLGNNLNQAQGSWFLSFRA